MLVKDHSFIYTGRTSDGQTIHHVEKQRHPASRATRLVDDSERFFLLSVSKRAEDGPLRPELRRMVHEGIEVSGISYRFLGFTDSQVKTGRLMFFHEDEEWTVDRLLSAFGDLPGVYLKSGYGKYSARLGLSFSSTVQSLDVPHNFALEIPDLVAADGSLHSDGCGMIRDSFAAQVCAHHGLPPDATVFQIRRGGIKGLLVRYPDSKFDNFTGRSRPRTRASASTQPVIAYRPSMYKYAGGPTCLELNQYNAAPGAARLNVQFMVLLLTLRVPVPVFERLVQDQLDLIGCILTNREKALDYIRGELDSGIEDGFMQGLYAMLLARQELTEPQLQSRLRTYQRTQYNNLREKLSIRIPESCYVFGVVDEDGVLGPDEVYINLPSRNGVLVREVVVGRSPAHHPGVADIRKFRAVDRPSLRHHRNCIVFSSTAPHSVPDSMSSGDLDGDLYFVTWNQSLIPPDQAAPFERTSTTATAPTSRRQISNMAQDAVDTFMQLKFNTLLGSISKTWSDNVDKTPDLAKSAYALGLVPLIESALDIMKSGEDYKQLKRRFKGLGQPPRPPAGFVGPIRSLRDMIPLGEQNDHQVIDASKCDPALIVRSEDTTLWLRHNTEAVRVMIAFNQELSRAIASQECQAMLRQVSAATDYESSSSRHDHFNNSSPSKPPDVVTRKFKDKYFGGGSRKEQSEQRMRASAWYHYGYTQGKPAFAWLGERYLNEIKACLYDSARKIRPCSLEYS
ncbi:RdRP-domain-containing protein [Epithele typhae]|uniref:RdRP-domain-containing protein n=1 Tax=Epithele typhae TaxID=378194 RepID=UPI002008E2D1|nr:RdRP-domain-containing protein [Epithele typhae]KAH9936832.1 RdRP-domain-containing protein [Epithele typhae]